MHAFSQLFARRMGVIHLPHEGRGPLDRNSLDSQAHGESSPIPSLSLFILMACSAFKEFLLVWLESLSALELDPAPAVFVST